MRTAEDNTELNKQILKPTKIKGITKTRSCVCIVAVFERGIFVCKDIGALRPSEVGRSTDEASLKML